MNIEQEDVRWVIFDMVQGVFAPWQDAGYLVTEFREQHGDLGADEHFVLHDKYFDRCIHFDLQNLIYKHKGL